MKTGFSIQRINETFLFPTLPLLISTSSRHPHSVTPIPKFHSLLRHQKLSSSVQRCGHRRPNLFLGSGLQLHQKLWSAPQPSSVTVLAKEKTRWEDRTARHARIRKKVEGTPDRPRLCVFRSNKHLYVQVIDDTIMHTLASASTMQKPISEEVDYSAGPTIEIAKKVGEAIAKSCLEKGITKVAFDRGGYPYHGRVEALAAAAREHGLLF